jgi:hypothetical protein
MNRGSATEFHFGRVDHGVDVLAWLAFGVNGKGVIG